MSDGGAVLTSRGSSVNTYDPFVQTSIHIHQDKNGKRLTSDATLILHSLIVCIAYFMRKPTSNRLLELEPEGGWQYYIAFIAEGNREHIISRHVLEAVVHVIEWEVARPRGFVSIDFLVLFQQTGVVVGTLRAAKDS